MTGLFGKKKTKKDIEDDYALALSGVQGLLQQPHADSLLVANDDEPAPVDITLQNSTNTSPLVSAVRNHVEYVSSELKSVLTQITDIVANDPSMMPLMTRALNALTNASVDSSAKNIRELLWTANAVSRKGDACKGLAGSMAGIGISLWLTSIIVAVAVTSAIALPITFGVGTALFIGGAVTFLCNADYLFSKEWDQSKGLAGGIRDIRATLSRL